MTYRAELAEIRAALAREGVDEARLEADLILSEAAGISRAQLLARLGERLDAATTRAAQALLARRLGREPLFYILRRREFYGREFYVGPGVLVPRPETETLVDAALREIVLQSRRLGRVPVVVDVGTGSGAIAVSLALEVPALTVVGSDVSRAALTIARANAQKLGAAARIRLVQSDLLNGLALRPDLIVSNPPYVSSVQLTELAPEIALFEPRVALDGGPDGLGTIRRLLEQASDRASDRASLLVEMGDGQWPAVRELAAAWFPGASVDVLPDLAGRPRVARIRTHA